MSGEFALSMNSAEARGETYGRLAQAFVYPESQGGLISGAEYTDAFDPAASQNACSLRGYTYAKDTHPAALYEELLRFYHFFGLTRAENAELPDHITVELRFMQFLATLEASASKRDEEILPLVKAQRDFLTRHLRVLANGIVEKFKSDSEACRFLVELTRDAIDSELARIEAIVGTIAAT